MKVTIINRYPLSLMVESRESHPLQRVYSHTRASRRALVEKRGLSVEGARALFFLSVFGGVLVQRGIITHRSSTLRSLTSTLETALGATPRFSPQALRQEEDTFSPPADLIDAIADDPINLGWAYQFWNESERDDVTWGVSRAGESAGISAVATATQVFTEDYQAEFLVSRCLPRRETPWCLEGASLLDPACGAGHIIARVIRRLGEDSRASADDIVRFIHGCDIDGDAVEVCRMVAFLEVLRVRSTRPHAVWATLQERVQALDQAYGSLERGSRVEMLNREHTCVITNPPYIGRRKMTTDMREYLDTQYPDTRMDLCSAFMQRCVELVAPGGALGLVTVDKWLRLKGYEPLRTGGKRFSGLYNMLELDVVCELGARAFNSWSSLHDGVGTALLTARRNAPSNDHEFTFISTSDYRELPQKAKALVEWLRCEKGGSRVTQSSVRARNVSASFVARSGLPNGLTASRRAVRDVGRVLVGLQTSDDRSYVRYVWSVPPDKERWLVHGKGGGYDRWYGLNHFVLDWREGRPVFERDPKSGLSVEQWFAEEGWTYTWFANGALGLRRKERGWSFGRAASSALFCDDDRLPAFLNSRVASLAVRRQGGKAQLPEGVVRALPIPDSLDGIDPLLVQAAVELKRRLVELDITDATFRPGGVFDPVKALHLQALLLVVEGELERQVNSRVPLSEEEARTLDATFGRPVSWSPCGSAQAWKDARSAAPSEVVSRLASLEEVVSPQSISSEDIRYRVERFFQNREKIAVAHRGLPATSLLERICRWSGIHPCDAAWALSSLIEENIGVRREVLAPLVRAKVIGDVLTLLGHPWWSTTERYDSSLHVARSATELAERVAHNLPGLNCTELLGEKLDVWIATEAAGCQRKLMRDTPLMHESHGRGSKGTILSHVWGAPGQVDRVVGV